MIKANFFIVGMQRAATTAMAKYLSQHKNIAMCDPKEPHFFADDLERIRKVNTLENYHKLFPNKAEAIVYGEASTGYLFSSKALGNIYAYNPNAKIVVMLRNPVDMIHSLHAHLLFCGHEDVEDFDTAWQLQNERKQGRFLPKDPRFHEFVSYYEVGLIGQQVEKVLKIFPKNQVKFIVFDNFVKNPKKSYEDILSFLKLESDDRNTFERVNENMTYWLPFYYQLRALVPWKIRLLISKLYKLLGKENLRISRRIFSSSKKSPRLTEIQRQMLNKVYINDIEKLADITKIDLREWGIK